MFEDWFTEEKTLALKVEELKENSDWVDLTGVSKLGMKTTSMLFLSQLVYAFAVLREIGKQKDKQLKELHLISGDSENSESLNNSEQSYVRGVSISSENIAKFVQANIDSLNGVSKVDNYLSARAILSMNFLKESFLSHYDDNFADTSVVYGITVSREKRRITVVFRGSTTEVDWLANFDLFLTEAKTPSILTEKLGFDENKKIYVHGGWYKYLISGKDKVGNYKYDDILKDITDLYTKQECSGYDLYITGHSLGGALSTLLSFKLAGSSKMDAHLDGRPIYNISFASPMVGDETFKEAFECLEKAGRIRHFRVSNHQDLVCALPLRFYYSHVGVNLHLNPDVDGKCVVSYIGNRSLFGNPFSNPATRHSLDDYYERKSKTKDVLNSKSIRIFYQDLTGFSIPKKKKKA
mmetsp:Transcript_20172/g.19422  ORF Transcript_20172/g.19422 Transcript_20172/m.19422 type:complete len:409 (-) Transcript_20172:227-1453(-)|eukprot:CAMPEP_0197837730 /NCGR_PEP_ID=MMETSP1437-20131217/33102_1 /TAXON_ID=49252 ORGANISM="Eucampia antarctica, Strain CCMP1452" /NCGR_SAMPLE_ID=MMETSP1437 /ASSEMBLY_ACC=CAM_ASM_001096 /LENGTH=408 /DNA_ID=CAMNT_0043445025 /DNA_START=92 /DNA_END=1318 /DNA_ORIENTATION=+